MASSSTRYFKDQLTSTEFNTVYSRYVERLVRLAVPRLSSLMRRKLDAEDVVQSALASFIKAYDEQHVSVQSNKEFWALLVTMTLRKCRYHIRRYHTEKRHIHRELQNYQSESLLQSLPDTQPTPEEVQTLLDLVSSLIDDSPAQTREILMFSLQNYTPGEIAFKVGLSERSVFRQLQRARTHLLSLEESEE